MGSKQSGSARHVRVCGGGGCCCWALRGFLPTAAVANSAGVVVAVGASFGFLRGAGSRSHEALVRVALVLVPALLAAETLPRASF
jgi:hypothetical protein